MQNLSSLILAIATLIGAITTFYQVVTKTKRSTPPHNTDVDVEKTEKEIKRLQEKLDKENKKK